jgi:putative heme-binding domain-containing protein
MSLLHTTRARFALLTIGLLALTGIAVGAAAPPDRTYLLRERLRDYAEQHDGSLDRGRHLYSELSCAACHGATGQGGKRGPRLIGFSSRYDRAEIIRSVLDPSQRIAAGFQRLTLTTTDGRTISGRLQNRLTDDPVEILTSTGKRVQVRKAQIETAVLSKVSDMPEGLVDELSREDFAALITYLVQLGAPAKTSGMAQGIPR